MVSSAIRLRYHKPMKKVLVGIPTFRRPDLLRTCLESVRSQRLNDGIKLRVLVADNDVAGEGEAVAHVAAAGFPFELIAAVVEAPGISAARNAILAEAANWGADAIAMIDDDETVSEDWLQALLDVKADTGADVVGGPSIPVYSTEPSPVILASKAFWYDAKRKSGPIDIVHATNNVLINCAALRNVANPTFDDAFGLTGGGDKEFFTRLKKAGVSFAWASDARAFELVPQSRMTTGWILRRNFRIGIDDLRIAKMHEGRLSAARKSAEALAVLAAVPVTAPALLVPRWRLRMLRRWSRAVGRMSGLFGRRYGEYALLRAGAAS